MNLSTIQSLVRNNIKNINSYISARDEFAEIGTNNIFLDANENPFGNGLNRYPDAQQKVVKEKLAVLKNVSSNQILLGNGSDEVLDLIFRVFCEPTTDHVILLPPTYGMYKVLADINAIDTVEIPLTTDFQPKTQTILLAANKQSKILFLCSPNNPTGNSFTRAEVEKLLKQFKGIVVIDEAYIDFSTKESWLHRLEEFPNLVITQTLSKAYGMAGIRLGVCYASKQIITLLNAIKPPYNINSMTQEKAVERLLCLDEIQNQIKLIKEQKEFLEQHLQGVVFVKEIIPSDANFILIRVDNANQRYQQLLTKGIVVRNRSKQINCQNCLRISIGTATENKKLIKVLKELE